MEHQSIRRLTLWEALALHSSQSTVTILAQILGNVFFINYYPPSWLPFYYLAQIFVTAPMMLFFKPIFAQQRRHITVIQVIFTVLVLVLLAMLKITWYWFPMICSLYVVILGNFYGIAAWHCVSQAFNVRQLKEINNTVMLISTSFASMVSFSLSYFKSLVSIKGLLIYMLGFMIIGAIFSALLPSLEAHSRKPLKKKTLFQYPLYTQLFVYTTLISLIFTLSDYALKYQLAVDYDAQQIARFFLFYYGVTNVLCLAVISLSRQFVQYISITVVLSIFPIYYLLASAGLFVEINLVTVAIFAAGYGIFYYSTHTIAREFALNALPESVSSQGRLYLKAMAKALGMLLGMSIMWFFRKAPNFHIVALLVIAISAFSLYLVRDMLKSYLAALQLAIALKRFDIPDNEIAGVIANNFDYKTLLSRINLEDHNAVKFALYLMKSLKLTTIPKEILALLDSPVARVRVAVVRYILWHDNREYLPLLYRLVDHESDERVIRVILHTIAHFHGKKGQHLIEQYLHSSNPKIRAGAIHLAISSGNLQQVEDAIRELETMITHENTTERKEAARLLGTLSIGMLSKELEKLMNDKDVSVAIAAVKSLSEHKNPVYIPLLIQVLGKYHLSYYSARALSYYGKKALLSLERAVGEYDGLVDSKLITIIAKIDDPRVENILMKILLRKRWLYRHCVARESAHRACRVSISNQYKRFALTQIEYESRLVGNYGDLIQLEIPDYVRHEIISRKFYATARLIYWIAVLGNQPSAVLELVPFICREEKIKQADLFRDQAIVLLMGYLQNRKLNKIVNECLVPKEEHKRFRDLSILLEDEWLAQVYRYYQISEKELQNEGNINMILMEKVFTLRATSLFSKLAGEVLLAIAEQVEAHSISKGEVIFTQGATADGLYIMDSGKVGLYRKDELLKEFERGAFFGELGLIDSAPRAATAIAMEDGAILFINKETFEEITYSFPEVLWALTETVLEYLRVEQEKTFSAS